VTLTADQAANGIHVYTGTLAAATTVTLPMTSHPFIAENKTTGAFPLTVAATGGAAQIVIPQGATMQLFCDGSTGILQSSTAFVAAQGVTSPLGDSSLQLSTNQFVQSTVNGRLSLSVAGNSDVNLTAAQAGQGVLAFTGALTGSIAVTIPAASTGERVIENLTTGPYTLTVKTPAGTGIAVTQGATQSVFCDGTNVLLSSSDLVGSGALPAAGGTLTGPLSTTSTITSGASGYTFSDGSVQGSAAAGKNRIINGACNVAQYGAVASTPGATFYGGVDRFVAINEASAGGQFTQSQGSITYNGVTKNAVVQTVNTAVSSLTGINEWYGIGQRIEGINAHDLLGQPVTVSFIFNTNVAGTYTLALRDGSNANNYVTTFAASANTPVRVVVSVPAVPINAGIPNTSAGGMFLNIGAINQGTYQIAASNSWQSGKYFSATGATNWGATAGNFIAVTDLQLEAGSVATPFERRSYRYDLTECQRYYQIAGNGSFGAFETATSIGIAEKLTVNMRAAPTLSTIPGLTPAFRSSSTDFSTTTYVLSNSISTVNGLWTQVSGFTGGTIGAMAYSRNNPAFTSQGFIACNSEL
jgi:hypothetical protein